MASTYCPGGRAGKRSSPFSFVASVAAPPISAGELRRTFACGSTPPCASLTVPISVPVNSCAAARCACSTAAARRNATDLRMAALLFECARTVTPLIPAVRVLFPLRSPEPLHGVAIDVGRDGLPLGIAGGDGAREVHASPHPRVVAVGARLRDAGIRAAGLSVCRQREHLLVVKIPQEHGSRCTVLTGMSGRVFRVRRCDDERQPAWIRSGIR